MTRPAGRWNDIPCRLKRHFGTVLCAVPSDQLLDQIFTATAASYFSDERHFTNQVQQIVLRLVPLTRKLWHTTKVSTTFLLTHRYFYCYYYYYYCCCSYYYYSCYYYMCPIKVGSVNKSI